MPWFVNACGCLCGPVPLCTINILSGLHLRGSEFSCLQFTLDRRVSELKLSPVSKATVVHMLGMEGFHRVTPLPCFKIVVNLIILSGFKISFENCNEFRYFKLIKNIIRKC
jgi:hypothetical protein